jgi:DNA-binding PadR family transcriptional regulator
MSVRYAILGLISQKPRHGYETRVAFESLLGSGTPPYLGVTF